MSTPNAAGAAPRSSDFEQIDYRPLTDSDNVDAFRAFRHWAQSTRQPWAPTDTQTIVGNIVGIALAVLLSVIFGFMLGGLAGYVSGSAAVALLASFVPALLILGYIIVVIIRGRGKNSIGGYWEQWYRSYHFAAANNLSWHLDSRNPSYPGSAFTITKDTTVYEHFVATSGRYRDVGNVRWVTGSGKSRTTHEWGFMALRLDRRIPHCVVDAHSNNGVFTSNMPLFAKDQVLHLEGDFDRYFTLYCPREYERDALYIFTPDLMALLIDNTNAFDVEIVDDWMFVYSTKPWDLQNAWTWYRLLTIAHTVGSKAVNRTERYRDERAMPAVAAGAPPAPPTAENNRVAQEGQRLTKRFNWTSYAIVGAVLVVILGVGFLIPLLGGR